MTHSTFPWPLFILCGLIQSLSITLPYVVSMMSQSTSLMDIDKMSTLGAESA
jgi:hypothetical protein